MNWKILFCSLSIAAGFSSGCLLTNEALLTPRKAIQGADLREDVGYRATTAYYNALRQYMNDKGLDRTPAKIPDIGENYMRVYLLASQYFLEAEEFDFYTRASAEECLETVFWSGNVYAYQYVSRVEATFVRVGDGLRKVASDTQYGEAAVFAASAASDCNLRKTGNIIETGEFGF